MSAVASQRSLPRASAASRWIRQLHRWLSIAFTLGVAGYVAAMTRGQPAAWVGLCAAVPLSLLFLSGSYLFALPYVQRRGARSPR